MAQEYLLPAASGAASPLGSCCVLGCPKRELLLQPSSRRLFISCIYLVLLGLRQLLICLFVDLEVVMLAQ